MVLARKAVENFSKRIKRDINHFSFPEAPVIDIGFWFQPDTDVTIQVVECIVRGSCIVHFVRLGQYCAISFIHEYPAVNYLPALFKFCVGCHV